MTKKISMKIEGMSCSSCANRLEKAINKLEGIEQGNVNFATEMLTVVYDEAKTSPVAVELAVEKAGFKVRKDIKDYSFKVKGMSCSSCANRLDPL